MSSGDPTAVLLQYGAIGAFVVILGFFAWAAYKRERDRADRLEQQLQAANDRLIAANERAAERLTEVLTQTRDALVAANDYLRDLARRRSE